MPSFTAIDVDEVKRETAAAFLFVIDGQERWVPKSQMDNPACVTVGETDVAVDIASWLARKIEAGEE